jgi:NAD(P)-dependent dehydrogenase (short-subunit alcohol dehydrogenase family)
VAVITGSSRGLGAGLAEAMAARGIRLGLCARSRPTAPPSTESVTASVDVTDAAAVDRFTDEVAARFGPIDLWINNAGLLAPIGPLADADPEELRANIEVNVLGVLYGSAAFARHVRTRPGGGVLVNLSSGAATHPYLGWAAYGGAKAAVDMITEVVAGEERTAGLRCYALSPGLIDTDMQALIRSATVKQFPAVARFRQVHEEGAFNTPAWVARWILERLVDDGPSRGADWGPGPEAGVRLRVPDEH